MLIKYNKIYIFLLIKPSINSEVNYESIKVLYNNSYKFIFKIVSKNIQESKVTSE